MELVFPIKGVRPVQNEAFLSCLLSVIFTQMATEQPLTGQE
jgi:hypothetical protein